MSLHKTYLLVILFLALLFVSGCQNKATAQNPAGPKIKLSDCHLSSPGSTTRVPAQCGQYEVKEDRTTSTGRMISLNLAVIPAVSRSPAEDPIFFLAGGPGEAATQSFLFVYAALNQVNQVRDIVLVDQRGTGNSNPLNCQEEGSGDLNSPSDNQTYMNACLESLDADPRMYTTSIAMDDLDEIRQALGYDQINLYGTSYGTRAAMVYARQYGEHVRSMILDGVVPLDWILGPTVAGDAQRALDLLFARCLADEICSTSFPSITKEFQAITSHLMNEPVRINLMHPSTGEKVDFEMSLETFANTIHLMSYSAETMSLIPIMIHNAYVDGDYNALAAQSLNSNEVLGNQINVGMRLSVICSEDQPFYSQTPPTQGYLGNQYEEVFNEVCEFWPAEPVDKEFKQALYSDIPTLLISGEFDPVTPPNNGDQAAKTLSNSLHILVPLQGHINLFRGCLPDLAQEFIDIASVDTLDTTCVQNIEPAPFFINLNGPNP